MIQFFLLLISVSLTIFSSEKQNHTYKMYDYKKKDRYEKPYSKTSKPQEKKSSFQKPKTTHNFIYDDYTMSRGNPQMLSIFCKFCQSYIMDYQKDGKGKLLRCYLDRIHHPKEIEKRQYEVFNKKIFPRLECDQCASIIGIPTIYEKENRPAYHMKLGSFSMKKIPSQKRS